MEIKPDSQSNKPNTPQTEPELEDTREFTEEEVRALGLYAEWIKHRENYPIIHRPEGPIWPLGV